MSTDKQTRLQELQSQYVTQLPEKLNAIDTIWQKARDSKNPIHLPQLRQLAHNLAGSAGTFGFPDVSIEARKLEELIKSISLDHGIDGTTSEIIADAIQRIVNYIERGPNQQNKKLIDNKTNFTQSEYEHLVYLITEDTSLANEVANQLRYFDYEVGIFSQTAQARTALSSRKPSALIVDVKPPDNDNQPAFPSVFNDDPALDSPIIFISAIDSWQTRLAAIKAHGRAFLTAPPDFNDLLEHLDALTMRQSPKPFKILIVEDMDVLAEYYALVLRDAGMQAQTISNMDDFLETLSDLKPDLILMDVYMPQCSGLDAAQIVRQMDELLSVPIVFLSTEDNQLEHLHAMELGGDDFLQKPITDDRLVIAVRTRAQRFRQLRSHMNHDGLTGLLNHAATKTHLEHEISRAQRHNEPLSFAMLDIDHFKNINDTYGHPAGDRVIKTIARMLSKRLRKSDLIGRYGGEEFAVILPDTDLETAANLLNTIREGFTEILHRSNQDKFTCTFSAGLTQLSTTGELAQLISTADQALYQAKQTGRNRLCTL